VEHIEVALAENPSINHCADNGSVVKSTLSIYIVVCMYGDVCMYVYKYIWMAYQYFA